MSWMAQVWQRVERMLVGVLAVVLLGACAALVWTSEARQRAQVMKNEAEALRATNETLARDNSNLAGRVQSLGQDPRMVEKLAREDYGMIRSGETVYLFPAEEESKLAADPAPTPTPPSTSFASLVPLPK